MPYTNEVNLIAICNACQYTKSTGRHTVMSMCSIGGCNELSNFYANAKPAKQRTNTYKSSLIKESSHDDLSCEVPQQR